MNGDLQKGYLRNKIRVLNQPKNISAYCLSTLPVASHEQLKTSQLSRSGCLEKSEHSYIPRQEKLQMFNINGGWAIMIKWNFLHFLFEKGVIIFLKKIISIRTLHLKWVTSFWGMAAYKQNTMNCLCGGEMQGTGVIPVHEYILTVHLARENRKERI